MEALAHHPRPTTWTNRNAREPRPTVRLWSCPRPSVHGPPLGVERGRRPRRPGLADPPAGHGPGTDPNPVALLARCPGLEPQRLGPADLVGSDQRFGHPDDDHAPPGAGDGVKTIH